MLLLTLFWLFCVLAISVHLPTCECRGWWQITRQSGNTHEMKVVLVCFVSKCFSLFSPFLLHSSLKVNLNQGGFSLLDGGHFFMSKEIKAIQAYTCHITRKILGCRFHFKFAISRAIRMANGCIVLLELLFYQSKSGKMFEMCKISV